MYLSNFTLFAMALFALVDSARSDNQPPVLVAPTLLPFGDPDGFGRAVLLKSPLALVAANGRVFVYVDSNGTFQPEAVLEPSDSPTGDFGASIGLAGNSAFVGAPEGGGGAVYQFLRDDSGFWTQVNKLVPTTATSQFGISLGANGDVLAVGAPGDGPSGAVHVFREANPGFWVPQTKIPSPDPSAAAFGTRLSVDAATFAVAAVSQVHIFVEQQGGWIEEDEVELGAAYQFGLPVVHLSGPRFVVGDPSEFGPVRSYVQTGSTWSLEHELPFPTYLLPGALSGTRALVRGAVGSFGVPLRLVDFQPSGWTEVASFLEQGQSSMGYQSSIEGERGLGVSDYNGFANEAVYELDLLAAPAVQVYCTAKLNSQGCTPTICFDQAYAPSASSFTPYWVRAVNVLNNKNGLYFYSVSGAVSLPFLGGVLCALPPLQRTPLQFSAGNQPPNDCSGGYAIDFHAWVRSGSDPALQPGVPVHGQFWSRDPLQLDGTGVGLTDAGSFVLGP